MARKKREEGGGGGNAPWLNTFADLMNLLLCFFVLLFAMSDVDSQKFEELSISMANSIGIFEAGGSSLGTGNLISSGMTQLTQLDDYFNSMGKSSEGSSDPNDQSNSEGGSGGTQNTDGALDDEGQNGSQGENPGEGSQNNQTDSSQGTKQDEEIGIDQAMGKIQMEREAVSAGMYDSISDLTEFNNLGDYIELSMDEDYRYVQLTLKGSILFSSGDADIKKVAEPILMKIGEILKRFEEHGIEITGHTDNVPMSSATYRDNNWLSSARALNAAEFLIDKCDVDPDKLKYSGRGEYEPIASNATADGRAKNRRIEIKIYNEYSGN